MENVREPIIYQNNQNPPAPVSRFSLPFLIYRLLILALIAFIIFALVRGFFSLQGSSTPLSLNSNSFVPDTAPRLALEPNAQSYSLGETISLAAKYYTGQTTIQGLDLDIQYDPNYLEIDPNNFFQKGTTFSDFPVIYANPTTGIIRISGIATPSQIGFNGGGTFGILQLKAKKSGNTQVDLKFTPGGSAQSNLIEVSSGQNILQKVNNAIINIQ